MAHKLGSYLLSFPSPYPTTRLTPNPLISPLIALYSDCPKLVIIK